MDDSTATQTHDLVLQLRDEMHLLERRIARLEGKQVEPALNAAPAREAAEPLFALPSDTLASLGLALLGIAGAYLIRALTEGGRIPGGLGVTAGMGYAGLWLWLAARTAAEQRFAVAVRVATSVLIFAPLVWEATVRFKVLPAWAAAAVVFGFCVAAEAISWRKNLETIARIVPAACAVLAMALLLGTYALIPFTFALLAIAGAVEFAAIQDRATARWFIALCADAAVLILTWLMRDPRGLPEGYPPVALWSAIAAQTLLVLIYGASLFCRTAVRGDAFRVFEIAQIAVALGLGAGGVLAIAGGTVPVGLVLLVCGIGCYAVAGTRQSSRNVLVYASLGLVLVAVATWMIVPGFGLVLVWCVLAIAASLWRTYGAAHAATFLWMALAVSGAAEHSIRELWGVAPLPPLGDLAPLLTGAVCYFLIGREGKNRIPVFLIAGAFVLGGTAWLAALLPVPCSAAIVLAALALIAAWTGARSKRQELVWLAYALMAADALHLAVRDLPTAAAGELVLPLVLFGTALMLLPRILRQPRVPV